MSSNDPVYQTIVNARISLLMAQPFFGNLILRQKIIDASKWCDTMATDGVNIYYNREFVKGMTFKELQFVLCHEVVHCIFDHCDRRDSKNPQIWNMAIDYITNYILVKANIGEMPKVGLYNDKYTDELTSDEVYRDLLDKSVEVKVPIDMHLEGITSDENGEVTVTVMGNGDGPPKITKEDMDAIRDKIKLSLIQAIASDPDKVPKSIKRLVDEFTNPKMDWRTMLDCHIKSSVKEDFTFNVPSRRSHSSGCIMPSQIYNETIDIAIAIDTSGSISEKMLKDFLSEVKGIMDMYTDFKIWLWCFDTEVHNPVLFNQYNIHDIFSYEIKGGGGTLFEANWDFMKDTSKFDLEVDEIMPTRFINFTDGYPSSTWGDENYVDTLFIIHGNDKIKAPFGMTAYYDENS